MNKDEALKMAIEALMVGSKIADTFLPSDDRTIQISKAINACKEALEQPAQEPVAWIDVNYKLPNDIDRVLCYVEEITDLGKSHFIWNCGYNPAHGFKSPSVDGMVTHWMPLPSKPNETNTHPHQWQGLTDDEMWKIEMKSLIGNPNDWEVEPKRFARAIQQALKEKNT